MIVSALTVIALAGWLGVIVLGIALRQCAARLRATEQRLASEKASRRAAEADIDRARTTGFARYMARRGQL